MKSETKIGYTVLRYVHDIVTQEFVNIGVLAYAPDSRQLKLKCSDHLRRVHAFFPDADSKRLSGLIRHVQDAFDTYGCRLADVASSESLPAEVMKAASRVLPSDSSALQWSAPAGGYDESLNVALNKAFDRYVRSHEPSAHAKRSRGISAVLKPFKLELQTQGVLEHIKRQRIKGAYETYDFAYTWKNHVYHCYEAVNLDLRDHKQVEARAMEWVGRATDLAESAEELRLYLLLAEPVSRGLRNAYEDTAQGMKGLLPSSAKVVEQSEILEFTRLEANLIKKHVAARVVA